MRVEILTTGEELTAGVIVDGNAAWLGEQLFARGQKVTKIVTVGDEMGEIVQALREGASRSDILVVTGGLGPTMDDLTVDAMCAAFDRRPVLVPEQLERIKARFVALGREFTKNNEKQALVPSGSEVLGNGFGTATSFVTTVEGCRIYCFPGVPSELRPLAADSLFPEVEERLAKEGVHLRSTTLRCVGIPESHLDQVVRDSLHLIGEVDYGILTRFPENHVRLLGRGSSSEEAEERCRAAEARLREILGPVIYGKDDDSFPKVTLAALRSRGWKVAFAESLTAGLASSLLAEAPGASEVLLGSFVTYSNEWKHAFLGVEDSTLESTGPVSVQAATEMAEGALERSGADLSVSLTGWAGGNGGEDGRFFVALASKGEPTEVVERRLLLSRNATRRSAAFLALDLLRRRALGFPLS